jgi:Poly(A) polymerase catalytic subunit
MQKNLCEKSMTFEECELAILRHAVDENEKIQGEKIVNSEDVRRMIDIVEHFLIQKKRICYGGTAINNILPKYDQFYDKDLEIPDYDFFSKTALEDAMELADIYYNAGFVEVEAKAGMHYGTFKVFVNFIPVADITYLEEEIYDSISKESINRGGIKYAPPNFLRMSMYLELSRPEGDVSRWEKVLKRLTLLNKNYPLNPEVNCDIVDFQRDFEKPYSVDERESLYFLVRDILIEEGCIFFGGYASSLYSKYMPKTRKNLIQKIPDFDVLNEEPEKCAVILTERLHENGFKHIKTVLHDAIGELIPERIEIRAGKETLAFIYKPIACHNYNKLNINGKEINVATIDTMLSFYLAFIYTKRPYLNKERILCMAQFLFDVEQQNRLNQKGLLKRFTMQCYGKQETIELIRAEKTAKFKELMGKRNSHEYNMWFLKYNPGSVAKQPRAIQKSKPTKTVRKTTRKTKKIRFMNIF